MNERDNMTAFAAPNAATVTYDFVADGVQYATMSEALEYSTSNRIEVYENGVYLGTFARKE